MKSFTLTDRPSKQYLHSSENLLIVKHYCLLFKLPLDIQILITRFLEYQHLLRWQATCKSFHKLLSDNSIWRGCCKRIDLYASSESKQTLMRQFLAYTKLRMLWTTSSYEYSIFQQKTDIPCGISFLDSLVSSKNSYPVISGSWTGDIKRYKLGLLKKGGLKVMFDPLLFSNSDWGQTPPRTPSPDQTPPDSTCMLSRGITQINEMQVLNFGRFEAYVGKINSMSQHNGMLVVGTSNPPYINFYNLRLNKTCNTIPNLILKSPVSIVQLSQDYCLISTTNETEIYSLSTTKLISSITLDPKELIKFINLITPTFLLLMCSSGSWYTYSLPTCTLQNRVSSVKDLTCGHVSQTSNDHTIFAGYRDGTIRAWSLKTLSPLWKLSLSSPITCLTGFGNMLVSGSWDGKVWIFDGRVERVLKGSDTSPVLSVCVVDECVITGHYNGNITVWDFGVK
jgi:hypothetical protein